MQPWRSRSPTMPGSRHGKIRHGDQHWETKIKEENETEKAKTGGQEIAFQVPHTSHASRLHFPVSILFPYLPRPSLVHSNLFTPGSVPHPWIFYPTFLVAWSRQYQCSGGWQISAKFSPFLLRTTIIYVFHTYPTSSFYQNWISLASSWIRGLDLQRTMVFVLVILEQRDIGILG